MKFHKLPKSVSLQHITASQCSSVVVQLILFHKFLAVLRIQQRWKHSRAKLCDLVPIPSRVIGQRPQRRTLERPPYRCQEQAPYRKNCQGSTIKIISNELTSPTINSSLMYLGYVFLFNPFPNRSSSFPFLLPTTFCIGCQTSQHVLRMKSCNVSKLSTFLTT